MAQEQCLQFYSEFHEVIKKIRCTGHEQEELTLYRAIDMYYYEDTEPELTDNVFLEAIWLQLKNSIDRMKEKQEQYKRDVENGKKGGRPPKKPPVFENEKPPVRKNKNQNSNSNTNTNSNSYFFKDDNHIITFDEAEAYKKEKKYESDLQQCKSYWELNGWTYKGLPLTDWQQVIDYWEKGYQKHKKKKSKSFDDFEQRIISDDDFKGLEKALMKGGTT